MSSKRVLEINSNQAKKAKEKKNLCTIRKCTLIVYVCVGIQKIRWWQGKEIIVMGKRTHLLNVQIGPKQTSEILTKFKFIDLNLG